MKGDYKMTQTINQTTTNDIQTFINIFKKKGKLLYKWHSKGIKKLARSVSPAYRDFVNKLLSNSKLKIDRRIGGCCRTTDSGQPGSLSKRAENIIEIDYDDGETFCHELGHSVDLMFGRACSLTYNVLINGDKTLFNIFNDEFNAHQEELHELLMNEYRFNINSNIYKGAYDVFVNNMPKYLELCKTTDKKKRKNLQNELYKCGFVEVYYQIQTKKCFKVLEQKFIPIMDALSSKYDITGMYLTGHSLDYYSVSNRLPAEEFFANVFADKVMGNHTRYDNLIKLMPRSFDAFERLFFLVYDRIQNNKRFTDLKLRPVYHHYEVEKTIDEMEAN